MNGSLMPVAETEDDKTRPTHLIIISHPDCTEHCIQGHPEQPLRVDCIMAAMRDIFHDSVFRESSIAKDEDIALFHTASHVENVRKAFIQAGGSWDEDSEKNKSPTPLREVAFDGDTKAMKSTGKAAYRAAGSAVDAVNILYSGSSVK
jgi:acetoin utilization deacetylase AcuC-like enzyme